jgi:predicted acyltransferase
VGKAVGGARFEALDVLRGLAILGMAFSGMVPYRSLPAWMYHAQLPPPSRELDPNVFGLTWVDCVFPMFLLAMGVAIPLALRGRIERGDSELAIFKSLLGRGLLLAVYALVGQHLRPFVLANAPGTAEWLISLAGFVVVGLILFRWPKDVPTKWRRLATAGAWAGAVSIIALWNYPDGTRGFANYRNDVILMVLANVAVSGGAVWLWTRDRPAVRWAIFAGLVAIFLTSDLPGLGSAIWNWDPTNYLAFKSGPYGRFLPILYHFEYHKYLLIVLPGTFAGDLIRKTRWTGEEPGPARPAWHGWALIGAGPVAMVIACVGLTARWVTGTTVLLSALLLAVIWVYSQNAKTSETLPEDAGAESRKQPAGVDYDSSGTADGARRYAVAQRLFALGAPLLIVGLLCEPIGGGIRKDPATISYFLVTAGLCSMLLASLAFSAQSLATSRIWQTIRDTGANPIMGYLVLTNLVWGVVGITQIEQAINRMTQNPLTLTAWGLLKTVLVAWVTAWFTRRKLFLRA